MKYSNLVTLLSSPPFSSSLPVCSIAECCSTPYSLLGLVFTVSFIALGVLTLCKFYLQGYRAFMNDNTMHRSVSGYVCVWAHSECVGMWLQFVSCLCRGMTEGITLLILAVQTGLIELQVIHRAFLLSIILFIVVASILQSMLEIADPIVLALGASRDKYDIQSCKQMECQVPALCVLAVDRLLSLCPSFLGVCGSTSEPCLCVSFCSSFQPTWPI